MIAIGQESKRIAVLSLALALVAGCSGNGRKGEIKYETQAVERGRLVAKVTATGTLSALVTVQVGSQVSGRLQDVLVDFNSVVKKGQLIARIDPRLFQASVEQARANLVSAKANLAKAEVQAAQAKRERDRTERLTADKLVPAADLETAQANWEAAQAQVEVARGSVLQASASLRQAETNLAFTEIHAPIDGTVISRAVDPGQTVAAGLQVATLFTIAQDLHQMQVDTSVAEADIGKLEAAQKATFTVDAYPGERFQGKVRQIRNAPQNVQNVVTYDVVIDVDNPELKLKPGMTANVEVVHAQRDEVLKVPNAALRFRPPPDPTQPPAERVARKGPSEIEGMSAKGAGDKRTVYVLRAGKPQAVLVRTGLTDGRNTEVVDGELKEGEEVVTAANLPRSGGASAFGGGGMGMGGGGGSRRPF